MKINKSELQNALEMTEPGLNKKGLIEFTNCFYFNSKRIITFNDEIYVSFPFKTDFVGMISSERLLPFISKIKPDKNGFIEVKQKKKEVIIKSGRTKSGFSLNSSDELPLDEIQETFNKTKWKKIPGNFLEGIKLASFCCSKNIETPIITCINVKKDTIQATDRFRCFIMKLKKKMPSFLLPSYAVPVLVKLKITKYAITDSWIHFITKDDLHICVRSYSNEEYPKIEKFFEGKGKTFDFPESLDKVIDKAVIFCDEDTDKLINISINKKRMVVSSSTKTDWFKEELKCSYFPKKVSLEINPLFLKDILAKVNKCQIITKKETIKFQTDDWKHIMNYYQG